MESKVGKSFSRDHINYSMVWEDPHILLESLNSKEGSNCLSISSAGCNSLAFLKHPGNKVVSLDLSLPQTVLLELKVTAVKHLDRLSCIKLFGYFDNSDSLKLFNQLKGHLTEPSLKYWLTLTDDIKKGIIHTGKLETYFTKFRTLGLRKIFSEKEYADLVSTSDLEKQIKILDSKQSHIEAGIKSFFNQDSFSKEGRSSAQYKYVDEAVSVEAHLLKRIQTALRKDLISENPYLYYIFNGTFKEQLLPFYLKPENFKDIKDNINNIFFKHSDIESFLSSSELKFDFFNLSDIFEYMSKESFADLLTLLYKSSNSRARIAYWNLFVDRLPELDSEWSHKTELSNKLSGKDLVCFYKNFNVLETK